MLRILASFVLVLSILYMPFYISIILAFIFMIYFAVFWEAVLLFLLSDLLFGVREVKLLNMIFISFFISLIAFILIELIKKKLKFYN